MNDVHGPMAGLQEVCHDIRQPIAGVLALAGAVLAGRAVAWLMQDEFSKSRAILRRLKRQRVLSCRSCVPRMAACCGRSPAATRGTMPI